MEWESGDLWATVTLRGDIYMTITQNKVIKAKLIGQTVLMKERKGGGLSGLVGSMYPKIGGEIVIRQSPTCGNVSTGSTSDPAGGNGYQQYEGVDGGRNQCSVQPGDTVTIDCPGCEGPTDNDNNNNNNCCITEPPIDEDCIRELYPSLVGSCGACSAPPVGGVSGGKYYLVDFSDDPIWVYPGMNKPIFYFDVSVGVEPGQDTRTWNSTEQIGVPSGIPPEGILHAPVEVPECEGDCINCYCLKCNEGEECCLPCNMLSPIYGVLWRPPCVVNEDGDAHWEKYQFWYPKGAMTIMELAGTGGNGDALAWDKWRYEYPYYVVPGTDGGDVGWFNIDGTTEWSIMTGPFINFATPAGAIDNYDPNRGGGTLPPMNYDECMKNLEGTGLSQAEKEAICNEAQTTDTSNRTACMQRLAAQLPGLSDEQLSTMCNEHPGWSICMIKAFYDSGGTKSEAELIDECYGENDSYSYVWNPSVTTSRLSPYPIYALMCYIGGTAPCPWGWPWVRLWYSCPSSTLDAVRVCTATDNEIEDWTDKKGNYEQKFPNMINK